MAKYPSGGVLNETAPSAETIKDYLKQHLCLSETQLNQPCWQELSERLGYELGLVRIDSISEGTPTEQKKELSKYIKSLKTVEEYLGTTENLPMSVRGLFEYDEYRQGITLETDRQVYRYILKKRLIAEEAQKKFSTLAGTAGPRSARPEYRLLCSLTERIQALAPHVTSVDQLLLTAAHILNDPMALGSNIEPFGNTPIPQKNQRPLSIEPEQIRKQLRKYGLSVAIQEKIS